MATCSRCNEWTMKDVCPFCGNKLINYKEEDPLLLKSISTEFLKLAEELRTNPNHWTKGAFARNLSNEPVLCNSKMAICWCTLGLLRRTFTNGKLYFIAKNTVEKVLSKELRTMVSDIEFWNDNEETKVKDVIKIFEKTSEYILQSK